MVIAIFQLPLTDSHHSHFLVDKFNAQVIYRNFELSELSRALLGFTIEPESAEAGLETLPQHHDCFCFFKKQQKEEIKIKRRL